MRTAGNAIRRGDVFDIALPCGDETVSCKVLVLQNDIANRVAPTVIVTPLVEGVPDNPSVAVPVPASHAHGLGSDHLALLSQIYTLDKGILTAGRRLAIVQSQGMAAIDKALQLSLGLGMFQKITGRRRDN